MLGPGGGGQVGGTAGQAGHHLVLQTLAHHQVQEDGGQGGDGGVQVGELNGREVVDIVRPDHRPRGGAASLLQPREVREVNTALSRGESTVTVFMALLSERQESGQSSSCPDKTRLAAETRPRRARQRRGV